MGLIYYLYFLEKGEALFFKEKKQELLINKYVTYKNTIKNVENAMFIEDSNIVKELIIVPQRNDTNSRNMDF